jgi:hypothetical protein
MSKIITLTEDVRKKKSTYHMFKYNAKFYQMQTTVAEANQFLPQEESVERNLRRRLQKKKKETFEKVDIYLEYVFFMSLYICQTIKLYPVNMYSKLNSNHASKLFFKKTGMASEK